MSTTTPDNEQAADVRCAIATHLETHEAASALELERMRAGRIATARRVLRLDTSVYEPAAFTVVRPGAMDFARIPSLLLGRRSVYWGTSR